MNVNDFSIEVPAGDMLVTIFDHQRTLMNKYHPVESKNVGHNIPSSAGKSGLHDGPLDINDRASQLQIKSFAWRITEEITEATLCFTPTGVDETHYLEELVDALHFSVELLIMSGLTEEDLAKPKYDNDRMAYLFDTATYQSAGDISTKGVQNSLRNQAYYVVEKLGEAMNRLKLKPWKSTAILTDYPAYKLSMSQFFYEFIDLLVASGFNARSATAMYLNKNAVNQFRIRSNY